VDYSRYKDSDLVYDIANMKQETIVNRGKLLTLYTDTFSVFVFIIYGIMKNTNSVFTFCLCTVCCVYFLVHQFFIIYLLLVPHFSSGLKDLVTSAFVNKHNNHNRTTLSKL